MDKAVMLHVLATLTMATMAAFALMWASGAMDSARAGKRGGSLQSARLPGNVRLSNKTQFEPTSTFRSTRASLGHMGQHGANLDQHGPICISTGQPTPFTPDQPPIGANRQELFFSPLGEEAGLPCGCYFRLADVPSLVALALPLNLVGRLKTNVTQDTPLTNRIWAVGGVETPLVYGGEWGNARQAIAYPPIPLGFKHHSGPMLPKRWLHWWRSVLGLCWFGL